MSEQHFQFSEGTSNKFWKIRLHGSSFTVRFGRVGTAGQEQTKHFGSEAEAEKECNKLVAEKQKKGYVKVAGDGEEAGIEQRHASTTAPKLAKPPAPTASGPKALESTVVELDVPQAASAAPRHPQSAVAAAVMEKPAAVTESEPNSEFTSDCELFPPQKHSATLADREEVHLKKEILFTDEEWKLANNGPLETPLVKPPTQPFDISRCIQQLIEMPKGPEAWEAMWTIQNVNPHVWSNQEAHFWLFGCSTAQTMAYTKMDKFRRVAAFEGDDPRQLSIQLQRAQYKGNVTAAEIEQIVTNTRGRAEHFTWVSYPLARLLSAQDFLKVWQRVLPKLSAHMFPSFNKFIVPYLGREEISALKDYLRDEMVKQPWNINDNEGVPVIYLAAASLAMNDELLAVVKTWPNRYLSGDQEYRQNRLGMHEIVFALSDPDVIVEQARRLGLKLHNAQHFYFWIGRTQFRALDVVYDSVVSNQTRHDYSQFLQKVVSQETARYIFLCNLQSHDKTEKKWLDEHPLECLAGLADLAESKSADGTAARRFVRDLSMRMPADSVPVALAEKLRAIDCPVGGEQPTKGADDPPDWLHQALNTVLPEKKKAKTPDWLAGIAYEKVVVDGWRLTDEQIEKVVAAIQQSSPETIHPLVAALREHGDRRQFDAFTWDLFSRWVAAKGPPKDKWAMYSLGFLSSEKPINQLVTLMQQWRESGLSQRAMVGLDVLRLYGTDYALMRVHEISQSPRLKSLRGRALEVMEEVAQARGMTKPELEDRIVPTCGLDECGSRIFDYGPRQFTFLFGPDLKPMVKDEKGTFKSELPAPNQKDDPEKSKRCVEEWKELKKQLKTVAKIQARRLEQAMVTGRSWSREDFQTLLLNHPLLTNLIRLIVWVAYDQENKPLKTFRVSEDKKFSDASDRETSLDGACRVAVIHPLHMSDEERSKWGEIFTDYEIVSLFPQIGRPIYKLEPGEFDLHDITRFKDVAVPAPAIPGTLERLGWWRGPAEDNGVYSWHYKHFYEDKISAVVEYDGIPMAMMQEWDPQKIARCFFVPEIFKNYWNQTQPLQLSRVPETIVSEVLYDLNTLISHSKDDEEE